MRQMLLFILCMLGPAARLSAAGPSVSDVLSQQGAHYRGFVNSHSKRETRTTILTGPGAGSSLPKQVVETWTFIDPQTGHRKIKILSQGRVGMLYSVDLDNYILEKLNAWGEVEYRSFGIQEREIIKRMVEGSLPADPEAQTDSFEITRRPELDKNGSDLAEPAVPEGRAEQRPTRLKNKRERALRAWHGKRVRCLRYRPLKATRPDGQQLPGGAGFDSMEQDIDMGTGVPVETRLFDKDGRCFSRTVTRKIRQRSDDALVPAETETVLESDQVKVQMVTDMLVDDVDIELSDDDRAMKVPAGLLKHPMQAPKGRR